MPFNTATDSFNCSVKHIIHFDQSFKRNVLYGMGKNNFLQFSCCFSLFDQCEKNICSS